jgi:DNA-binding MarR family transcriptional regulator
MYKMQEDLEIPLASISRNAKELCRYIVRDPKTDAKVYQGYNLLEADKDPENLRRVIYRLTPKGKELKKELESILNS